MTENNSSSLISVSPNENATTYYDLFVHNHGHTTAMLAIIFIGATISTFGFVLNSLLVLATIKSKRLNTFCHHLIGFDALCLAFFHLYPLITFLIVLSQVEFVALNVCFFLLFVPQFFINVQYGVMVQIGVERLANILFPIWSLNKKSQKFHLFLLSIYIAFCFALMALQYSELFNEKNMVFCQMADISSRPGLEYSIASLRTLICRSAMIIIYASIFILLKAKNLDSLQSDQKDIYKAVMLIMLVEIVFWVPGTVLNKLFYLFFDFSNIQKTYISAYISTLSLIGSCLNAPILFVTCKGYREALNNLLPAKYMAKYRSKSSSNFMSNNYCDSYENGPIGCK